VNRIEKISTLAGIIALNVYTLPAFFSIVSGHAETLPAASHIIMAAGIAGVSVRLYNLKEWLLLSNNALGVIANVTLAAFAL
jgi:hypothetical protein